MVSRAGLPAVETESAATMSPDGMALAGGRTRMSPTATVMPLSTTVVTFPVPGDLVTETKSAAGTCTVCVSRLSCAQLLATHAAGSDVGTASRSLPVTEVPRASRTRSVTVLVPVARGYPEITPARDSERPGGSLEPVHA